NGPIRRGELLNRVISASDPLHVVAGDQRLSTINTQLTTLLRFHRSPITDLSRRSCTRTLVGVGGSRITSAFGASSLQAALLAFLLAVTLGNSTTLAGTSAVPF